MFRSHSLLKKVTLSGVISAAFLVAFGGALTQVTRTPQLAEAEGELVIGAHAPAKVEAILRRACQDCHSARTTWPWYAALPPVSWKIHKDVARARDFMDFSKWDQYSEGHKRGFLAAIAASTQSHLMPPREYLWIHGNAKLSDTDRRELKEWALAESKLRAHVRPTVSSGAVR